MWVNKSTAKLQLKWADGEARRLGIANVDIDQTNKLLITNIPDTCDEGQIVTYLKPYGTLRVVKLVKGQSGSMGNRCYVKFTTKEQALLVVKELSGNVVLPGGTKPIEVIFAETLRVAKKKETPVTRERETRPKPDFLKTRPKDVFYEFMTPEGMPYYFNVKDNKTQWERPDESNAVVYSEEDYYAMMKPDDGNAEDDEGDDCDVIKLLIKNLPKNWSEDDLGKFVRIYGDFEVARIVGEEFLKEVGKESGGGVCGVVELKDTEAAQNLVNNVNGLEIEGNTLEMDVL